MNTQLNSFENILVKRSQFRIPFLVETGSKILHNDDHEYDFKSLGLKNFKEKETMIIGGIKRMYALVNAILNVKYQKNIRTYNNYN